MSAKENQCETSKRADLLNDAGAIGDDSEVNQYPPPPGGWPPGPPNQGYPPPPPSGYGAPPQQPQIVVVKQGGATEAWFKMLWILLALGFIIPAVSCAACVGCTGGCAAIEGARSSKTPARHR
ncbi:MAG TPA: hypothetical protein VGQ38_15525 [Gaiellaceae bacterium]|nr:hypothetical protein [Gaiellaceae bacterium]